MLILVCLLALRLLLPAQYTTGRVDGTVTDPAGAAVPGAAVTLANRDTNIARRGATSDSGAYFFAALPPGRYRLLVEMSRFAPAQADFEVASSETQTHNFRLALAQQSTAINVTAEGAPVVNTFEPLRAVTRGSLDIQTLPNGARNIENLITLAPGVTPTFTPRARGSLTTLNIAQAGWINSNGGRSKAVNHQLDATDANDWEFGGIALNTQPAPDMLQEFKVLTNNWAAEYGVKSNAQVLMVTRSGTNAFHGVAYDYLRNSALNSRDFFDDTGKPTPIRQNYYGFAAGGPLRRDRTFLFGGWEGRKTRGATAAQLVTVPSETARSQATDPSVQQLLRLLPLPTARSANPLTGTLSISAPAPSDSNQFLVRGDHYFASARNHTVAARYFEHTGTSYNRTGNSLPAFDATFDPRGRNAMIALTSIVDSSTANELRLSYGRASALFSPYGEVTPRFSVPGLVGFGTVQSWPQGRIFNVYSVSDVFSRVRGRHILKAGFEVRRIEDNSVNDSSRRGVYSFASINTFLAGTPATYTQMFGNTYRGFRAGYHGVFAQDDWKLAPSLTLNLGLRWEFQGGLSEVNGLQAVLDPRLPGDGPLGSLRRDSPVVEGNYALASPRLGFAFNPGLGRFTVRGGYGIYFDSLIFNGLQAGRYTPPSNYTGTLTGAQIAGANSFANLLGGTAQVQRELAAQVGEFGALRNLGAIAASQSPTMRNPYVQHFSLGLQSRLAPSLGLDVAYVGAKGTALTTLWPANSVAPAQRPAPAASLADEQARLAEFQAAFARANGNSTTPAPRLDPRFATVNLLRDNGSSIYHSLQVEARKSLSWGLQFQAAYTWSKSIDNASDYTPGQATTDRSYAQDMFNFRAERGPSVFDIPHRLVLTHVWQPPFKGRWLGGWTFSSINQWQSGIPFTIMSGARRGISDVNMDGDGSGTLDNVRAACVAGGRGFTFGDASTIPLPIERGVNGMANSANFKYIQPLLGNHGTCGRNTERMNRLLNFDWAVARKFRLRERFGVELRAEAFNVFDTVFLTASGDDYRNLASPNFGLANAAGAQRNMQLSLRLLW